MTEKYKVGDRVRITSSPFGGEGRQAGAVGTVSQIPSRVRGDVEVAFTGADSGWGFRYDEIEPARYKPAKGDHVRVVIEGEVETTYKSGSDAFEVGSSYIYPRDAAVVSVEKVEPPVETFKPGDVVRGKDDGFLYSIGRDGYLSHTTYRFFEWAPGGLTRPDEFTSERYERVTLS